MALIHLNEDLFEEYISSATPVLVVFSAPWCGPCKALYPILDKIVGESGKTIGVVDIDENEAIEEAYSILSIPTLMVFQNSKPLKTVVGSIPKEEILQLLDLS